MATTLVTGKMAEHGCWVAEAVFKMLLQAGLFPPFEKGDRMDGVCAYVCDNDGNIIHTDSLGNTVRAARFIPVALQKARMAARSGESTREMVAKGNLRPGDTKWAGGVYSSFGFAVGVSGIQDRWDEALAEIIKAVIEALIRAEIENISVDFLPEA